MARRLILLILLLLPIAAYSTHIRGGQIRVLSTNGLTVSIEVRLMTNTGSEIKFGEGLLDFGDGTDVTSPTIDNTKTKIQGVGFVTWNVLHTYKGYGIYTISYLEPNLNGGILNMFNSVETRFYTETRFILSPSINNYSPIFPTDPIFLCPLYRTYSFSTAAIDSTANDYFYQYSLVTPKKEKGQVVGNYRLPDSLKINPDNGIVTWGTKFEGKYVSGTFWINVKVVKWSKSLGYLGEVVRAMQIITEDSNSTIAMTSSVSDPNDKVVVTDSQQKKIKVILSDRIQVSKLDIEVYYNKTIRNNITVNEYDSTTNNQRLRVAVITLKTTPDILADVPYPIIVRGTASYLADLTLLYLTKEPPKGPDPDPIVTGLPKDYRLSVYPNPFYHELNIETSSPTEATLINSAGQVVLKVTLQNGEPVNTASVPAGLYFLKTPGKVFKLVRN